jgi:hypothetical protein
VCVKKRSNLRAMGFSSTGYFAEVSLGDNFMETGLDREKT